MSNENLPDMDIQEFQMILRNHFPWSSHLINEPDWSSSISDFLQSDEIPSAIDPFMPKSFYAYLMTKKKHLLNKFPFLQELMWMEWLEIELYLADDLDLDYLPEGDLTKDKLVLNPIFQLEIFKYPVHLKNAERITDEDKGEYYFIIFRNPENDQISRTDLDPIPARIIELLSDEPLTISELVDQLQKDVQGISRAQLESGITQFIEISLQKKLILGFLK